MESSLVSNSYSQPNVQNAFAQILPVDGDGSSLSSRDGQIKSNYWARAMLELQVDQPSVILVFSELQIQQTSSNVSVIDSLLSEVNLRKGELEEKRWKHKFGDKTFVLHDQLIKIAKAVQAFKDLGGTLAGLDPIHAGLPWAGICFLMQLTIGDADQYDAMVSAAEEVSVLISRYKHVEYICQRRQDVEFRHEFEDLLVKLYKRILQFQVSAASYYGRNTGMRFLRSTLKLDDVADILGKIRRADAECTAMGEVFNTRDEFLRHSELLILLKSSKETLDSMNQQISRTAGLPPKNQDGPIHVPFAFDADPKFTGREDIIEQIEKGFKTYRRMALVGWAGIGKSQIAIEYAHRVHKDNPDVRIFWVRGARPEAFLKSYRDTARKLKLPRCDEPEVDVLEIMSDWLNDPTNGDWLMVLDNVDDETIFSSTGHTSHAGELTPTQKFHGLQRFLPQTSHGSILVTSRNRVAARDVTNEDDCVIHVDRLPDDDAMSLFRKKVPSDKSPEEDFKTLLGELDNLPLAITQAAAYISKSSRMTVSRYLGLFKSDQVRYLEMAANDIRRDAEGTENDFSNSVLKTWFISFNQIKDKYPDAAENLCFLSVIFGQAIPFPYLLCGDDIDENEVEESIGPLLEFELVSEDTAGLFSIHRLVQLSVRSWLSVNDELFHTVEVAAGVLEYRFPTAIYETWKTCELLIPHVEVVLSHSVKSSDGFRNFSLLLSSAASYYNSRGRWRKAIEMAHKSRQLSDDHFSEGLHVTRCRSDYVTITAELKSGNSQVAESVARSLFETMQATPSEEAGRNSRIINLLGQVLIANGKYEEAQNLIQRALRVQEEAFGKDAEENLGTLANLALVQNRKCQYLASCETMKILVDRSKEMKGALHSVTLLFMNNYGSLLNQADRPEEAHEILLETLRNRTMLLTEDHPDTIQTMANYVMTLILLERVEEARQLNDKGLDLVKINNLEGDTFFHLLHNKGYILKECDQVQEARSCMEEVVRLRRTHLGSEHPETMLSILILAQCEMALGNSKSADEHLESIQERCVTQLGKNHTYTIFVLGTRSQLRQIQGRTMEALALAEDCLAACQQGMGPDHITTIKLMGILASILESVKRYAAVDEMARDALERLARNHSKATMLQLSLIHRKAANLAHLPGRLQDSASTFDDLVHRYEASDLIYKMEVACARKEYAGILCKLQRYQEAESLSRRNLEVCERGAGKKSRPALVAMEGLALMLAKAPFYPSENEVATSQGDDLVTLTDRISLQDAHRRRLEESFELLQQYVRIVQEMEGGESESYLRVNSSIAQFYKDHGQREKALSNFQSVWAKRSQILGPDSPETLDSAHEVAELLRVLGRSGEAEKLCRKTWLKRQEILGEEDPTTMASKNNLALCLRAIGEPQEALRLDQELLEDKIRVGVEGSLEVALTMNNIAMDFYDLKNFRKAKELLLQVVEIREEMLGESHEQTLLSASNLALVCRANGELDRAVCLYGEVVAQQSRVYGHTHELTIESRHQVATSLRQQGEIDEAIDQAKQCISDLREALGENHGRVMSAIKFLGLLQYDCKAFTQAEGTYRELQGLVAKTHQWRVEKRLEMWSGFAAVLKALGKQPEAERPCRKAFKGRQVILGVEHKDTLFSAWSLIDCLISREKTTEAEVLCVKTLALRQAARVQDRRQIAFLRLQMANICFSQGRSKENIQHLEAIVETVEASQGELNWMSRPVFQNLINAYHEAYEFRKAYRLLERLLQLEIEESGGSSARVAAVTLQIATLAHDAGDFALSVVHFSKVKELYETSLQKKKSDHDYLVASSSLAEVLLRFNRQDKGARNLCDEAIAGLGDSDASNAPSPSTARKKSAVVIPQSIQGFNIYARIVRLLFALDRLTEAEEYALTVINEGSKPSSILPREHSSILNSQIMMARIATRQSSKKKEETLELLRDCLFNNVRIRGSGRNGIGPRVTCVAAGHLGEFCGECDKFYEGEVVLRGSWRRLARLMGEDCGWTVEARRKYGVLLAKAFLSCRVGK